MVTACANTNQSLRIEALKKEDKMERDELISHLDEFLGSSHYSDYCPNGLQVEGKREIKYIIAGVTANQALIDVAIERNADALLVHHGWFWKNESSRIIGIRKNRLRSLLTHDINLIAYHFPLDGHIEVGNNAQLARRMDWSVDGRFGDQNLGYYGNLDNPLSLEILANRVSTQLERESLVIGKASRIINRVAWCSGGGQGFFEQAISLGADLYLSGEISEQNVHLARETGIAYIAAGHHATERLGIRALASYLAVRFDFACEFIDIDNPV